MSAKIGTTKATFDTKVPVGSGIGYKVTADAFENLGKTFVGLVELQVVERTEPSDFDADKKVKFRVTSIELALDEEHTDELRQQMADVYASRTGDNTLFEQPTPDGGVTVNGRDPHTYVDTTAAVCGHDDCGEPAGALIDRKST